MGRIGILVAPLVALTAGLFAGCSGGGTNAGTCTPGASSSCVCPDGSNGAQVCALDGSGFGACSCAGPVSSGGSGGSQSAKGTGGKAGTNGTAGSGGVTGAGGRPSGTGGSGASGGTLTVVSPPIGAQVLVASNLPQSKACLTASSVAGQLSTSGGVYGGSSYAYLKSCGNSYQIFSIVSPSDTSAPPSSFELAYTGCVVGGSGPGCCVSFGGCLSGVMFCGCNDFSAAQENIVLRSVGNVSANGPYSLYSTHWDSCLEASLTDMSVSTAPCDGSTAQQWNLLMTGGTTVTGGQSGGSKGCTSNSQCAGCALCTGGQCYSCPIGSAGVCTC